MVARIPVQPALLTWACERNGRAPANYLKRFPKLDQWIAKESAPTLKQLENFAKATHTPIGQFFLAKPPEESIPLPDFRTIGSQEVAAPSPNLLDTIYLCERRQEWYRNYARATREAPIQFVGSASTNDDVLTVAHEMRSTLSLDVAERKHFRTWAEALRQLVVKAEDAGILVMTSGVVGTNTHRKLDPDEFRGFALSDELAPVVFVNGADTKSAQMFTLAHEIAHIWLGQSALSDAGLRRVPSQAVERWCNQVAAEFLVPLRTLETRLFENESMDRAVARLCREFKVSSLVILRRLHDAGVLSRDSMWEEYQRELSRLKELNTMRGSGGDFHPSQVLRVSRRFAQAICASTWEGHSTITEAFSLLGVRKTSTLKELSRRVGVEVT